MYPRKSDESDYADVITTQYNSASSKATNISLAASTQMAVTSLSNHEWKRPDRKTALKKHPLWLAAGNGDGEVVRQILDQHSFDLDNVKGLAQVALIYAALGGHLNVILLLMAIPDVDVNHKYDNTTALIVASREGHAQVVTCLLGYQDIDVNLSDDKDATPLLLACQEGHKKVVRQLLSHKNINVNQADHEGAGPLVFAAQNGHLEIVDELLAMQKIRVNQSRHDGVTALFMAAHENRQDVVVSLLKHKKININQVDERGATALATACVEGHLDIVKQLLADPRIDFSNKDDILDYNIVLEIARENGHDEIFMLLCPKILAMGKEKGCIGKCNTDDEGTLKCTII